MAYEVTATRKRPQGFDEFVGQEFVVATLKSSLVQKRIAHAYLFSGPRGVGKTSAARILAKALNCENGISDSPCGVCTSCTEIARGNSLDVIEIDGASNTSVNDVRELKDEVLFTPNSSRYKIYIIDEVHMLSNSAFNALLKTIEEPPPYVVFVFATTEIHKVPATIRSRCQQFNFRLIGLEEIKRKLRDVVDEAGARAEEEALLWISKEATGSLRDAYTVLDQILSFSEGVITLEKIRQKLGVVGIDEMSLLVRHIANGESREALEYADEILRLGVSVDQFVIDLCEFFRGLLFLKHGVRKDSLLGFSAEMYPQDVLNALSVPQLEKSVELLLVLYRNLRFSLNSRYEFELLVSRLSSIGQMITPQEILEKVRALRLGTPDAAPMQETSGDADVQAEATIVTHSDLAGEIAAALRPEKLALASSVEKAASCTIMGNEMVLNYDSGDRFSGELVQKERDTVAEKARQILSQPVKVKINFLRSDHTADVNEKAEVLKKVFRGEIVEGE